jgi:hypothetical protein
MCIFMTTDIDRSKLNEVLISTDRSAGLRLGTMGPVHFQCDHSLRWISVVFIKPEDPLARGTAL